MKCRTRKNLNRLCSMLVAAMMILSILPMNAFATDSGEDYIAVSTVEDLYNIRNDLTANYKLVNNIDLTEATAVGGDWDFMGNGWNPIGSGDIYAGNAFSGEFDGDGHSITGLRIAVTTLPSGTGTTVYVGLFANVTGSVKNLTISGSISFNQKGDYYVGSVAGTCEGTIEKCINYANVSGTAGAYNYDGYVGGITGSASATAHILNCANNGDILSFCFPGKSPTQTGVVYCAGGIVAYGNANTEISRCYNTGNISARTTAYYSSYYGYTYLGYAYAAGIARLATISDCYNVGDVETIAYSSCGYECLYAYGIGGTASYCYNMGNTTAKSAGYGVSDSTSTNCFYLSGTGKSSTGATSLTESQMLLSSLFTGFDFETTWTQNVDAVYPYPQLISNPHDLRVIVGIELANPPAKTSYSYGEEFDVAGCEIKVLMESGDVVIPVTEDMVTGYDASSPGTQVLTITYLGFTETFSVIVNEKVYIPVSTVEDLYNIRNDLGASYILVNDIDLTEATAAGGDWDFMGNGWNPIGSGDVYAGNAFSGEFDGNGHSITGLRIDVTTLPSGTGATVYVGLFAKVTGSVKNLTISGNINYKQSRTYHIGSVAGACEGIVENVVNNADVSGTAGYFEYDGYVGGIVGSATGTAQILSCANNGDVQSLCYGACRSYCDGDRNYAGGIVGYGSASTIISRCFNAGEISARATAYYHYTYSFYGYAYAAGISETATITDCYNSGDVVASAYSAYGYELLYAYGIGGTATCCYNVGNTTGKTGRYGISDATSTNCYYLVDTGSSSTGATSLTDAQMRLQAMYVGFDFTNTWVLNSYANHPYPQLKDNVQNLNESVSVVSIISWPTKTEYLTGDELELDGCCINVIYVSGRTELLSVTPEMVSGFDNTLVGEQTITVTYLDGSDTFPVTVKARPEVSEIQLICQPNVTEFLVGTAFDFTGAQIGVSYSDNTYEVVDVTLEMTSGGNIYHLGAQTITVTFYGMTTSFEVTVIPVAISSLILETKPDKLTYLEGEELDLTGMQLVAVMNNGTMQQVPSGYSVSGFSSEPGVHTITISYLGKSVEFEVTVVGKTVVNLTLRALPTKTTYVSGESFDSSGMMVVATFDNGDVEVVEDYVISGFDAVPGVKTILVSYGNANVAFTVSVIPRVITDFSIVSYPAKLEYIENEAFDPTGLRVEATYNDGTTTEVSNYELVGFSSQPGTHTISVVYEGWVKTFDIHVSARVMTNLTVVPPEKLTYFLNEAFDESGMVVMACYNNGQQVIVQDYSISGFDSSTPGIKTITIGFGGFTSSFCVSVNERSEIQTNGSFRVANCVGRLGETVTVPVSVFNNTGLAGFKHSITFDTTNLQFVSAACTGAYEGGTVVVNDEQAEQGTVTILWVNSSDVVSDGEVYYLTFRVLETAQDGMTGVSVSFSANDNGNVSGENVLFEAVSGSVEVRSYWLGDLNGDRLCRVADLLLLAQYTAGKEMELTAKQLLSADVNEDNLIDIHDVILLQQWILDAGIQEVVSSSGLMSADGTSSLARIALGKMHVTAGQEVVVPMTIADNSGISAFLFEVGYDSDALTFVGAGNGDILNKGTVVYKVNEDRHTVTVLWYSASGDVGDDGELVSLAFEAKDGADGCYDLNVSYAEEDILNENGGMIPCVISDGEIYISSPDQIEVTLVERTQNSATFVLTNLSGDSVDVCVVAAAYDAYGRQVNCFVRTYVFSPSGEITVTVELSDEAESLKLYVLDVTSLAPIQNEKSIQDDGA